jgi:hypothetical protein
MKLLCDVYSHLRPHHCYGRKGEEVELIRDDGTVLIVQAKSGDRFPVTPEKISFESDETTVEQPNSPAERIPPVVSRKVLSVPRSNKSTQGGSFSAP